MKRFVALMTASALALSGTPVMADGSRIHGRDRPGYDWRVPGKLGPHAKSAHRERTVVRRYDDRRVNRHHFDRYRFERKRLDHRRFDGHRQHRHHKDRNDDDAWLFALGGLAGGLVIGSFLAQPEPTYAAPPPAYRGCEPTTGIGYLDGHAAEFGGTWCVDAYGRGSVVPGSEYFIRYL